MKITIETPAPGEEDEIIIKMAELDDEVLRTIRRLKDGVSQDTLAVYADDSIRMIPTKEIYYFDATSERSAGVYMMDIPACNKVIHEWNDHDIELVDRKSVV